MSRTALAGHLLALIRAQGPISVARFMAEALGHPKHGYYITRDPFGVAGDFVTAPEISQMFGELIGLWLATVWQQMGTPSPVHLVELGPGRGTLMADALRAAKLVPEFRSAIRLHLVETSPTLRKAQAEALSDAAPVWHNHVAGVPAGPMLLVANEFFDALPVRQYERTPDGWHERLVDADGPDGFRFVLSPVRFDGCDSPVLSAAPPGAVWETAPAGLAVAEEIAARLAAQGGAALLIDYGYTDGTPRATLQALRGHKHHPVLEAPGSADLTALVDFAALADTARAAGATVKGPVPQGRFLDALGIGARAARLSAAAPAEAEAIEAARWRLTHPDQMGSLFQAMAITHPHYGPLPGLT